jgi:acyl carrier protein
MGQWIAIALIVSGSLIGVPLVSLTEKRRALRHMRGRQPRGPSSFAVYFFQGKEVAVAEKMIGVLARHLPVDLSMLHPDDLLVQHLRMDSLDSMSTVEFVFDIEKEFAVTIPDNVAEKILTFRQLVEFVAAQEGVNSADRPVATLPARR